MSSGKAMSEENGDRRGRRDGERQDASNPQAAPPRSFEAFQTRLAGLTDRLPRRLRQCADYIAAHPDRIPLATVAEIARGAGVQPSAVIRFCQLMGFSGFSEMQALFREHYAGGWPDYATRLANLRAQGEDSPGKLLAEFTEAGRASLERLAGHIASEMLETAVSAMLEARVIHIAGMGRAFPVAAYLAYAFDRMGIPSFLHDRVGGLDQRNSLLPGDVLLVISFSPYAEETVALARHAAAQGAALVAITDAINSPYHALGAHALTVKEVDVGAFRSLSATLILAITLAVAVGTRRHESG